MYFRDANNENVGKGFGDKLLFFDVLSDETIVTIDPVSFNIDTEITITFDASIVYLHSGVALAANESPGQDAWTNAVGNWGQDYGVGELTSAGDNLWEITLTPKEYYGLSDGDEIFWIAMVFRSADGGTKAGASSGELPNGVVGGNGDFFVRNQTEEDNDDDGEELVLSVDENQLGESLFFVYPNPSNGTI